MPDRSRPIDLVLFGATGFVGKLTAEYLAKHAPSDLRWALGGRSHEKLERLAEELSVELPLRVGDSHDEAFLSRLAAEARVVVSTVGPYAKYGSELVAACAAHGTHYCDLTGELQWIRRMIDQHQAEAERTGARIVHCCGFDSIPSDMGTFMVQEHALSRYGAPCSEVKLYVDEMRGGASGGTIASIFNVVDEVKRDRSVRKVLGNPYSLNPEGERQGPDGSDQKSVRFDAEAGAWTAPFLMASVNARIVRRSNALLGYPYGEDFRYDETLRFARGAKGVLTATSVTLGIGALFAGAALGPTRKLLERRLPAPGQGPSKKQREKGFFRITLVGKGRSAKGPFQVRGRVEGTSDPGYGETSKMLGESALCLTLDELSSSGGILTPAASMGQALLTRLRAAGMVFDAQ